MNYDNILNHAALAGMRSLNQWIIYQVIPSTKRPGKLDKIPLHHVTGFPTSVTSPASWTDVHTAVAVARPLGPSFGVGFCFTKDCGYWFLDLDSCLGPGGERSPLAQQMVEHILPGAAMEVSVSGKGLHLFGRGRVPPHSNRNDPHHAEFYTSDRFCALSGDLLQGDCDLDFTERIAWTAMTYFPARSGQTQVSHGDGPCADWRGPTDDADLLRRAMQSRSARSTFGGGATFADLWHADEAVLAKAYPTTGEGTYDASSADAALAQHLAFWTGKDHARIDGLMRQSALARAKWEREDYMARTIGNACAMARDVLIDPLPASDVISMFRTLTQDEVRAKWLELAIPLSPTETDSVLDEVEKYLIVGRRVLQQELKQARAAHNAKRKAEDFAARAGKREMIEHRPAESVAQAIHVERAIIAAAMPGDYVSFGGTLTRVAAKPLPFTHMIDDPEKAPPPVPQMVPLSKVDVLANVERVAVFYKHKADRSREAIAVPDRIVEVLHGKSAHAAPVVTGLVTHPIVLPSGEVLASDGLHPSSGMFLWAAADPFARPYAQHETVAALQRLRGNVLEGFEFATPLDADVALAGLMTGVQRRVLDQAPGLAVLASAQSSGKTTVARRIHLMLTGHDMPAMTFPVGNEAEMAKLLLSTLLRGPAMVVFDNVPDGIKFESGSLAAALTSASIDQRVLGASNNAIAPTNTLFTLTGNNLSLGRDEITRWLVTRLAPTTARPEERKFLHTDVVTHAQAIRAQVLRDVVGVVAGYLLSGAGIPAASRFIRWDRMVRQPLMWAGAHDVGLVFRANASESEDTRAHRGLLWGLRQLFGDQPFHARDIATPAQMGAAGRVEAWQALVNAFELMGIDKITSAKALGRCLEGLEGRVAEVDGLQMRIRATVDRTGTKVFRTEVVRL